MLFTFESILHTLTIQPVMLVSELVTRFVYFSTTGGCLPSANVISF